MQTNLLIPQNKQVASHPKFEFNLEGLRGFAAMLVVFHHVLSHKYSLDPTYTPNSSWLNKLPGHSSVLLFFILSGYVIGLTNTKAITIKTIFPYIRKRLTRLYPIYAISLLFTLSIATNSYSIRTIIGNFLFLQNSAVILLFENNPLWSLNSEIIYYLLFIPLSYFTINYGWASICSGLLGIICITIAPHPLASSYLFGFAFWTSGLWLAQTKQFTKAYSSYWLLIALLFFFIGYESLNPATVFLEVVEKKYRLNLARLRIPGVFIEDLVGLPFYFFLFLKFTNHKTNYDNLFLFFIILICFSNYCYTINTYGFFAAESQYLLLPILCFLIGTILFAISCTTALQTNPIALPTSLLKFGSISYGIYVIHFPISIALSHITIFSGSPTTFSFRLLLDLILVLGAAYLLEIKIQPWFRNQLNPTPLQK